jgi:amidase
MLPATDTTTFGSTRNPWNVTRTPGGSSGGSGAATAAGLCAVALGSDGAGSIRTPSAWCGLFGIKPTRDRVPIAPHHDAWQGLSVNGPLARTVADAAVFLDAVVADPPEGGFAGVVGRDPRPLRVAVSTKAPAGANPMVGAEERRAVEATAALLRELGHEVVERDPDYPPSLWPSAFARVLRGIADDVDAAMPHPERLERRTRRVAAVGRTIPDGVVRWAREGESAQAARLGRLWDAVDVLLTPTLVNGPYEVGAVGRLGTAGYLLRAAERLSFLPAWNITGQPGCSVPAGFDDDGLPVGVQFIGRHGGEATLLALAAQIERARPWADRRPPIA